MTQRCHRCRPAWRLQTVPYRVHLWWVALLTSGVLLVAAQWALPELGTSDAAASRAGLVLAMLAHLAAAAAALLTLFVVKEIADRQESRVERIGVVRGAKRPARMPAVSRGRPPVEAPIRASPGPCQHGSEARVGSLLITPCGANR